MNDDNANSNKGKTFSIEKAKSGRASCKECKKKIPKDVLRIGKYTPFKNIYITHFFHVDCAFKVFKRARVKENIISGVEDVDGIDNLAESEITILTDAIQKANSERLKCLPDKSNYITRKKNVNDPPVNVRKSKLKTSNIPSMKILFTNADQLTGSKMCELIAKISHEKPMLVAVSEVKLKNSTKQRVIKDFQIPNYTLHPVNLTNNVGRGMAVYSHESIDKSTVQIVADSRFEEACLLEIRLRVGDVMLFCCCYRSPTIDDTSDNNNDKLNRLMKTISNKKYSHRCIVGDFNFRHINWTN